MRKLKLIATAVIIALACVGVYYIYKVVTGNKPVASSEIIDDDTPVLLDSIKSIGQWSLLSIEMDQTVDTVDNGLLGMRIGCKPVSVQFHGILHYGIDMKQLRDDWARTSGDTVWIILPPVKLLDTNFLDERKVTVIDGNQDFINKPSTRSALAKKAKAAMVANGNQRIGDAEENAKAELRQIFAQHGFRHVYYK